MEVVSDYSIVQARCQLVHDEHIPQCARYPVIDSHNHFWGDPEPEELLAVMDQVGVQVYFNLTGNTQMYFGEGGYVSQPRDFGYFKRWVLDRYPKRFMAYSMSGFSLWDSPRLFAQSQFVERTIAQLDQDVRDGACGLKVLKQLGLYFVDNDGAPIPVDDPRLNPIWHHAADLGIPVLIHTGDPNAFFDPPDEANEHSITLKRYSEWGFHNACFSKQELLDQRDRMIARHPKTTFILPHMANYPENLKYVARLMESFQNIYIDFSGRIDELGRQPYTTRDFMIQYQDRILFGTDMPISAELYRCYFRWLETRDEYFNYPNYEGGWDCTRWRIYGLFLPDEVLKKIYHLNALKVFPQITL